MTPTRDQRMGDASMSVEEALNEVFKIHIKRIQGRG